MAEILLRQHRAKDAIPLCRRAMDLSATVLERDPQYSESKMDMAEAKSVLGQALIEISAKKKGVESLSEAIRLFSEILNIDSQNAEVQSDKMAATQALAAAVAG
jgi:hypothetical protein